MRWILLLLLVSGALAAQPTVPALTGRVVDRADILSDATEAQITALQDTHRNVTGLIEKLTRVRSELDEVEFGEFAGKLQRIDRIQLTPDTLSGLLSDLREAGTELLATRSGAATETE